MTYLASEFLDNFIKKKNRDSVLAVLFGVFLYYIICSGFYYNFSLIVFQINLFVVGIFILFFIYSVTVRDGKKRNKIVNEITIDSKITFTTYPYRFLFYSLNSKNYTFEKNELKFERSVPIFKLKELNVESTICITVDEDKIYILCDFFPAGLKEQLGVSTL